MRRLFLANLLMTLRNRQALFWTLFFPLIFIFIFGLFFSGDTQSAGTVALIDEADTTLSRTIVDQLKESGAVKVNETYADEAAARTGLRKNDVGGIVILPAGLGSSTEHTDIRLITSPANPNLNGALHAITNGLVQELNLNSAKQMLPPEAAQMLENPPFGVDQESTSHRTLTYFDFILVGIIGMSLMNSSVNGVSIAMSKYREDQILKRITTTPLPTWKFIVAEVLSRLVINVIQVAIILLVGTLFFNGHIYGNLWILLALSLLGAILFQLLGFVIAAVTATTRAAEGMTTAITMPMMFLAGVFFPTDTLPQWLQGAVKFLPLEPLLTMLRQSALEEISPLDKPLNMGLVLAWIVALLLISTRKFKLNER